MRILTVLGTRPEIIRLSRVIEKLDAAGIEQQRKDLDEIDANGDFIPWGKVKKELGL